MPTPGLHSAMSKLYETDLHHEGFTRNFLGINVIFNQADKENSKIIFCDFLCYVSTAYLRGWVLFIDVNTFLHDDIKIKI